MYSVYVDVRHSHEYASLLLPSFYPRHVERLLEDDPVPPNTYREHRYYVLRQKYAGSTPISTLRRVVEAEIGIPLSVQSHFAIGYVEEPHAEWGEGQESDAATLDDAWAVTKEEHKEEGIVEFWLMTTAWRLREIFSLDGSMDQLSLKMLIWRHHVAALRYLRNAMGRDSMEQDRQDLKERMKEYERLERASSKKVRNMFWDWDRLIGGLENMKTTYEDDESMESREQEIETRFGLSSQRNEAGGKNVIGIDQQSVSEVQKQSNFERPTAEYPKPMESRLAFDFPPAKEKIVTKPLRSDSGQLRLDSDGFTLRSGVLLWGQLHTVFAGSINRDFQRNAEALPSMLPDGTIMQSILKYRSAARNGKWKIRKAFGIPYSDNQGPPTEHFGWVVFHEDFDPVEVLNRCSRITAYGGISNWNRHVDRDVLYVGRYDWSIHCDPGKTDETFDPLYRAFVRDSTGARLIDTEGLDPYGIESMEQMGLSTRRLGLMLALDADHFSADFMKTFIQDCPNHGDTERIFLQEGSEDGFGALVSKSDTEYEFAWLLFSGNKHETFREADELVAIVYDGLYRGLESHTFAVESDPPQS
ncbi:hypothetical protein MMC22_004786 [Lobaria immixta]|nr:hypothetical protein [Lobaria immixta]